MRQSARSGLITTKLSAGVAGLFAILAFVMPVAAQQSTADDQFSVFAPHRPNTLYTLDHTPWTEFLRSAVYITGRSDRKPAMRDDNTRITGTRASTGSRSRYRYEGNRVLFQFFDDGATDYAGVYRDAVQDTVNRIEYGDLSRNEQLAFWLNLYNAVVIHEIAKVHPVSRPSKIRAGASREPLFDAKLVNVHGVDLSLNDIRFNIVYRYWRNPNVIYGFWSGEIGSPNILKVAYRGETVQTQLAVNAREFINSLRGVDRVRGDIRVSKHYIDARPFFFKSWPDDLYTHLNRYADYQVADIIAARPANVRASKYAFKIADIESGETVRYSGNDNPAIVAAGANLGGIWSKLSGPAMRGGLSGEALKFAQRTEARKEKRTGSVIILDIRTDDPDEPAPKSLSVESDEDANGETEDTSSQ